MTTVNNFKGIPNTKLLHIMVHLNQSTWFGEQRVLKHRFLLMSILGHNLLSSWQLVRNWNER